jgi:PHD/YefM family antitoxin component YafN of YafNO toxin-antitoxin module
MDLNQQDIQFVIGSEGKPTAVLVDISTWDHILDALEDAEDVALAKEALAALDAAGGDLEKAGFISWLKAKEELE